MAADPITGPGACGPQPDPCPVSPFRLEGQHPRVGRHEPTPPQSQSRLSQPLDISCATPPASRPKDSLPLSLPTTWPRLHLLKFTETRSSQQPYQEGPSHPPCCRGGPHGSEMIGHQPGVTALVGGSAGVPAPPGFLLPSRAFASPWTWGKPTANLPNLKQHTRSHVHAVQPADASGPFPNTHTHLGSGLSNSCFSSGALFLNRSSWKKAQSLLCRSH